MRTTSLPTALALEGPCPNARAHKQNYDSLEVKRGSQLRDTLNTREKIESLCAEASHDIGGRQTPRAEAGELIKPMAGNAKNAHTMQPHSRN